MCNIKEGVVISFRTIITNWRTALLWSIYALALIGVLLHIFYIIDHNPVNHIWSDPERHWVQGIDTQRNDPMAMTDPVIYQLYIATLAKLTFKDPALVAFYTILLSLLAPWIWYRFFRELQPSKMVAISGGLILIWLPSWLGIYSYFMQETLMLPLLGLALWMTWRCKRKKTVNSFLLVIFLWSIAGLTRGICIPMAAIATTWLWLEQAEKIKKALGATTILLMILGPLIVRGYQQMGVFAPHGMGKMNVLYAISGKQEVKITYRRQGAVWYYGFGSPATGQRPFAPLSDWKTRRTGRVIADINIDKGSEDWKTVFEKNELTFSEYLWITKENLIFLFFAESWPDCDHSYLLHVVSYWMRWLWAPLGIAAFVITATFWRSQKRHLLLPSIILGWIIVQGLLPLAVNEGRYRKPFEGLLIAQVVLLLGTYQSQKRPESVN
ncbi:MAG: hypothetical protein JXA04_04170 [Gammaproteobacteria bacterium]|nr:hypothetical protein [Gammaproteobacteria bacterium]